MLAKLGPRLDWPHRRTDDKASRAWTRWAEAVARRRWLAAGAGMAVILALALAATDLQLGASDADTIAKSGDAKDGLVALEDAGHRRGLAAAARDPGRGRHRPRRGGGATCARSPASTAPSRPRTRTGDRGGTAIVEAIPVPDSGTDEGEATLEAVRDTAHAAGPDVPVGGQPAANDDFIDAVYGSFPLMIALITITTFILLARAFRSLLLPAKAIVLNILSVAAAWGVLVLVWQHGYGSELIFGIEATGSIPSWMPLMIFAFLFGLSMDYEVFILSPDAGGVRPHRLHGRRGDPRHRAHRPLGHQRRADPVPRVHRDGIGPRYRPEDDGHRAWRRGSCSTRPSSGR